MLEALFPMLTMLVLMESELVLMLEALFPMLTTLVLMASELVVMLIMLLLILSEFVLMMSTKVLTASVFVLTSLLRLIPLRSVVEIAIVFDLICDRAKLAKNNYYVILPVLKLIYAVLVEIASEFVVI